MFLQQLIEVVKWPEYIDGPWWSMVACRLHLWRPSTTVISIGMELPSLVKLLFIYLKRLKTIIKYFGGCKLWLDSTCQVFFIHRKQDFSIFCIPFIIDSCMEEVLVGVIYSTLLDSIEGDLRPPDHMHRRQYIFSNINEKKIQIENPCGIIIIEPQCDTEPLLIISISIMRHSELSCSIWPP